MPSPSFEDETNPAEHGYRRILVAVDCSDHSNAATEQGVALARVFDAELTGLHAYAAKLHDHRFKQMEAGLPEAYRKEDELERQRDVHGDLISRGLSLISDSYLDQTERRCREAGIPFRRIGHEGRNYSVVLEEARSGGHDLLLMGSQGLGSVRPGVIGTVCERVVRRTPIDTLVIKDLERRVGDGPILVTLDGSHQSYGGLLSALDLGARLGAPVHAIAVFDPYFHYVAFNRIAEVLSEEAGQVFRFQEQEKLHEEIIDSGLAKIYQAHLRIAESIAGKLGAELETTLLDGKPYDAILKKVAEVDPSLLVMGKTGIHTDDALDIGGTTQNLLRLAECNLLIGTREHVPDVETIAEETIAWTEEAEARMESVPSFVRNMARMAILRYAQDRGHTVVTASIVEDATAELMPGHAHLAIQEIVAAHDAGSQVASRSETLAPAWSEEARALLEGVEDPAVRANLELRAEKNARRGKSDLVEPGHLRPLLPSTRCDPLAGEDEISWTDEAQQRIERVPEGFMREASRSRVKDLARREGRTQITLEVVEGGLAEARGAMGEAMQGGGMPGSGAPRREWRPTLPWDPAAEARLERVPEGFMRTLTAQRIEARAERLGLERISAESVEEQFAGWQSHSDQVVREMEWDEDAWALIERAPSMVLGMIVREVEAGARRDGLERVERETVERAQRGWEETGSFHVAPTRES